MNLRQLAGAQRIGREIYLGGAKIEGWKTRSPKCDGSRKVAASVQVVEKKHKERASYWG